MTDIHTMPLPRRLMALAAAVAMAVAMLATAPAALAQVNGLEDEPTTSDRVSGPTRFHTAAQLALDGFGAEGAPTAIVATGLDFPDALAANYLAGQLDDAQGGPVLLTAPGSVPQVTLDALNELGVEQVLIMGGPEAVNPSVEARLAQDYDVERIRGVNRFETAAAVALSGDEVGELNDRRTALLATGNNWPDAMLGGSIAFAGEFPLLLTPNDAVHPATMAALEELQIEQVVVLGGPGVVSDTVVTALGAQGYETRRVSGGNRTATAAAVATLAVEELGFDLTRVNIATGTTFPDALTGGPNAGRVFFASPILLTDSADSLGAAATQFLEANCAFSTAVRVFGGPAAVSASTAAAAQAAVDSCAFSL